MKLKLGYIGLGKMGYRMAERLLEKNYEVVVYNRTPKASRQIAQRGAVPSFSLQELVENLSPPRLVWLMVPYQAVDLVLAELTPLMQQGDTIIDGGNSHFSDSVRRSEELTEKRINFLDVGVSGGPYGARHGACLMVGGNKKIYQKLEGLFRDLAVEDGYGYFGASGTGHFVKMIHNGIEYGMMQAIAEGFDLMKRSEFRLRLTKIAAVYNHGSVIESRLMGWMQRALKKFGQDLQGVSGVAQDSGEGEWTVATARRLGVPVAVINEALRTRRLTRKKPGYQGKIITALRNQFGGHSTDKK